MFSLLSQKQRNHFPGSPQAPLLCCFHSLSPPHAQPCSTSLFIPSYITRQQWMCSLSKPIFCWGKIPAGGLLCGSAASEHIFSSQRSKPGSLRAGLQHTPLVLAEQTFKGVFVCGPSVKKRSFSVSTTTVKFPRGFGAHPHNPLVLLFQVLPSDSSLSHTQTCTQTHTHTVAMSIDAVASSMMRMLLFLTKALARQNNCL